jgi:hypothetical protein
VELAACSNSVGEIIKRYWLEQPLLNMRLRTMYGAGVLLGSHLVRVAPPESAALRL